MLSMINTKPELLDQAVLYMKVFALGMPATAIYNFGNGVLSARGDTKRPMYYLAFAGILNVILNLIFVIVFHMAAVGVATASAIAQYVSGGLILIHLMRRDDMCKVSLRKLRYHNIYGKGFFISVFHRVCRMRSSRLQTFSFNPVSTLLMRSWFPEMLPLRMQII